MSLTSDEEFFERARWGFAISQRFRHICYKFRGTFRLAIQVASTNFLLPTLPRSLAYVVLLFLIISLLSLCVLLYLSGKNKEDPDLFEAIKSSRKSIKDIGFFGAIFLLIFICFFWLSMLVGFDKVSFGDAKKYAILLFISLFVFIIMIVK